MRRSNRGAPTGTRDDKKLEEYEVESILEVTNGKIMIGSKSKLRQLFLIKWKGYEEPTWEPRENIICVELLEDFLAKQRTAAK